MQFKSQLFGERRNRCKNCTWGAYKSLDIEEKTTKDVAKWPVRLEENLENLVWESQGRTCFQEKELQQITLIE